MRIGCRIGALAERDRPQSRFQQGLNPPLVRNPSQRGAPFDPMAKPAGDLGFVQSDCAGDPRALGLTLCFAHRQPFGASQRGGRIEPQPPAPGGQPKLAVGITAPGDVVGVCLGEENAEWGLIAAACPNQLTRPLLPTRRQLARSFSP